MVGIVSRVDEQAEDEILPLGAASPAIPGQADPAGYRSVHLEFPQIHVVPCPYQIIPSALVSLRLRGPEYSMIGCSKSSSTPSPPPSDPADNSPWRTSLSAINSRFCNETPSGHDSDPQTGHFGPSFPGFSLIGDATCPSSSPTPSSVGTGPVGDFTGAGEAILEGAGPRFLSKFVP